MTLDALARLVNRGFEDVQKRFASKADVDALEDNLRGELATKLDLHDQLEATESRLTKEIRSVADEVVFRVLHDPDSGLERRFHGIEKRIGKLERQAR